MNLVKYIFENLIIIGVQICMLLEIFILRISPNCVQNTIFMIYKIIHRFERKSFIKFVMNDEWNIYDGECKVFWDTS